jgi:hypothetical protein
MISCWPLQVMAVWTAFVIGTVMQSGRLLRRFRERYPQLAEREIPYSFDNLRHPEKTIYFFRKRAVETLRADPDLWREHQRFVVLVIATIGFWVAGVVTICILGILLT